MTRINDWLLSHGIRIAANPCISPDFCLDWPALRALLEAGAAARSWPELTTHESSRFALASGQVVLMEHSASGDCAWFIDGGKGGLLADGIHLGGQRHAYPCTWANLVALKNLVLAYDAESTIFPVARGSLLKTSIGVGARFTTLHWPGVAWAMANLGISLTANQNSIPRELVYDVEVMLDGKLDSVPFPFIGGDVPEGHQGQSVEGMSHGSVLTYLKLGFHRRRIPWGFNADHQPIGGKYDSREDALVRGSLLASYITFDLSPEMLATPVPADDAAIAARFADTVPADVAGRVRKRVADVGLTVDDAAFRRLLVATWPALRKMKVRDGKYADARRAAFSSEIGRAYVRELSIDELPGLTTPETLATMLAACEALDMPVQFVAPAFGFQKNFPFEDKPELERRIGAAWSVAKAFGVSIGFHSGSGKSADNYQVCGRITGGALEIKTSGRYTYEMGRALSASSDAGDQALWRDWYAFTRELALASAFGSNDTERAMARSFIERSLADAGVAVDGVFASPEACRTAVESLPASVEHMFHFEYNFLFVLAANGRPEKAALGDHSPAGYAQRARFYAIAAEGRLRYARNVAEYLVFLCENTGIVPAARCAEARTKLAAYTDLPSLLADIPG